MKKPTSVPNTAERNVAAHRGRGLCSSDCRLSVTQPSTCAALTVALSRAQATVLPISG